MSEEYLNWKKSSTLTSSKEWQYEVVHGAEDKSVTGFVVAVNASCAIDEAAKHACFVHGIQGSEIKEVFIDPVIPEEKG
jgi:hypothetical protein